MKLKSTMNYYNNSFIIFIHSLNNFIICFDNFVNGYYIIMYIHTTGCGEDLLECFEINRWFELFYYIEL